jgi:hypothetical protein
VAFSIGAPAGKDWGRTPALGKLKPAEYVNLGKRDSYHLELKDWAPPDWDRQIWLTVDLENGGTNATMTVRIKPPLE